MISVTPRLIETKFPLIEVNMISEYEMSFLKVVPKRTSEKLKELLGVKEAKRRNLPKLNNLFFYPARIPPSATRAITLASLLDSTVDKSKFLDALGIPELIELVKSTQKLATLYMVEPNRDLVKGLLGNPEDYVVVDPMAGGGSIPLEAKRVGLTVVAGDYNPVAYLLLRASIEFPAKYGERLYRLVNDEAKKLIAYVKEELGKYYPQDAKGLIYFLSAEHDCGGAIPLMKEVALYKEKDISWRANPEKKRIEFKISNSPPQPLSVCPFCNRPISVEQLRKRWTDRHKELIDRLLQGDEKAAEEAQKLYALAAVQLSTSKYREPTIEDELKLIEAARELAKAAREDDIASYLPVFPIPEDNNVFKEVRRTGLDSWHYLFNPRQLLTVYKVVKYIRERAESLRENYGELGVAVALYLALGFAKALNYNSLLTQWDSSQGSIRDLTGSQYALNRSVELGYDFAEANVPFINMEWAFEAEEEGDEEETGGGLLPVLKLLSSALGGLWKEGKDAVYLWDARELDKYLPPSSVDLINVDPPYYEQHDYGGISEFFWAVLQTALRSVLDDLFPRGRVMINWDPYSPEIPKRIEMRGEPPRRVGEFSKFGEDFSRFLRAASRVLKPEGLLVVWYAYGKLHGWEELFYRFYEASYEVTKAWQVWTQLSQRRVALHTKAFFTSMVIVARPNAKRRLLLDNDPRLAEEAARRAVESLRYILDTYGKEHLHEALVVSLADGIAAATAFETPTSTVIEARATYRHLITKALNAAVNAILKELTATSRAVELDAVSRLYLMLLLAANNDGRQLRVSHDFASRISQVVGATLEWVLVKGRKSGDADVLMPPADMARRGYVVSRALRLIYEVSEKLVHGVRVAEEYAREHGSDAPLALTIADLAWDKLGIAGDKDLVLNVLRKAA